MRGEDPSRTNNKHCSLTLSQGASREEVAPLGLVAGINFMVMVGGSLNSTSYLNHGDFL